MQRYFVDKTENLALSNDDIFHLIHVMRSRIGDKFEICDNENVFLTEIVNTNPFSFKIVEKIEKNSELSVYIRLLYCIPKGDKLDLVIQKACEIGISEIVLVNSSRCVAKIDKKSADKKIIRFNKIIKEACEQSKRVKLVKLNDIIDYKDIGKYPADLSLIAYENENSMQGEIKRLLNEKVKTINILVGAEGGFSLEEVEFAKKANFSSISLGKRILRSETACIYLMSILSFLVDCDYGNNI